MDLSAWVGIPYADRGRARDGADCWGLACLVYADAMGITLPSYADEYRAIGERARGELHGLIERHRGEWREIAAGDEGGGDLVLLRVDGAVSHVGIVAAAGHMLTVRRGYSSAIELYRSRRWRSRVDGFVRYRRA